MSIVGHRRVSTVEQNFDRQDLGAVNKLFEEKLSGKCAKDRPALNAMLEWVREDNTIIVHSIDRLASKMVQFI